MRVRENKVISRRSPKLPEGCGIEWPYFLEVQWVKEVWSQKSRKETGKSMEKEGELNEEAKKEFTDKDMEFTDISKLAPTSSSAAAPSTPTNTATTSDKDKEREKRDKLTISHIRKQHSAWDKNSRDFAGIVRRSQVHDNSKGCKFEKDLELIQKQGAEHDKVIMDIETYFIQHECLTDSLVVQAASACESLKDCSKKGQSLVTALKSMWKIGLE